MPAHNKVQSEHSIVPSHIKCVGVAELDKSQFLKSKEDFIEALNQELIYLAVDMRTWFLKEYDKAKEVRENAS